MFFHQWLIYRANVDENKTVVSNISYQAKKYRLIHYLVLNFYKQESFLKLIAIFELLKNFRPCFLFHLITSPFL